MRPDSCPGPSAQREPDPPGGAPGNDTRSELGTRGAEAGRGATSWSEPLAASPVASLLPARAGPGGVLAEGGHCPGCCALTTPRWGRGDEGAVVEEKGLWRQGWNQLTVGAQNGGPSLRCLGTAR